MAVTKCPYEPTILDEDSGTEVTNEKYKIFMEGAIAGYNQRSKELEIVVQRCNELAMSLDTELKRLRQPVNSRN